MTGATRKAQDAAAEALEATGVVDIDTALDQINRLRVNALFVADDAHLP